MTRDESFRLGEVLKDPAEDLVVGLNFFSYCANLWAANEEFSLNEFIRPTRPTGFSYKATTAGCSGAREPVWPEVAGSTVEDGSIVWTCAAAGSNGLAPITSPSATSDPTGLTISSVSVEENTRIIATYQGGWLGQDYDVVFTFTLSGLPRVARQTVKVRKR
jgi:hypothetical protein